MAIFPSKYPYHFAFLLFLKKKKNWFKKLKNRLILKKSQFLKIEESCLKKKQL